MYVAIALSESEFGEAQNQSLWDGQNMNLIFNFALCVIASERKSNTKKLAF